MNLVSRFALRAAALFLAGSALLAQSVLVVGPSPGPGVDFTSIQAAIAAALDGDVVLVREGTYPEDLLVTGKGLVLQAEKGADVLVDGGTLGLTIENVPAGSFVAVRGIGVSSTGFGIGWAAFVQHCDGPVWIEAAELRGQTALELNHAEQVILRDCALIGVDSTGTNPQAAVVVGASSIALFGCTIRGSDASGFFGEGMDGLDVGGGTFGAGSSEAWVYDTTISGGSAPFFGGGDGLVVQEMSQVDLLGATLSGGAGSPAGQASRVLSGKVTSHPEPPRSMSALSPNRAHGPITVEHRGLPGDSVWDLFAPEPAADLVESPTWVGPLVVSLSAGIQQVGALPDTGKRTDDVLLCQLGPGAEVGICFDQPFMRDAATQLFVAGAPTMVVHLRRENVALPRDRPPRPADEVELGD